MIHNPHALRQHGHEAFAFTAVQECATAKHSARVVFGTALRRVRGARGPIALFAPGTVVGYRIVLGRYCAGYVFRTAASAADGCIMIPGVSPAPYGLLGPLRSRPLERAVRLLQELAARTCINTLRNGTYLRAARALHHPHLNIVHLADTLIRSDSEVPWICSR